MKLVTLAAGSTGLGEVSEGEGVLGIQRAFQISGARATMASLWPIDERPKRLLMERFYENLWKKNMTKLDALRESQLWLMKSPDLVIAEESIDRNRSAKRASPYFGGGLFS